MSQQEISICRGCERDTFSRPHAVNCPVLIEQTNLKCDQLGMKLFYPEDYNIPTRLDPG